MNNCIFKQPTLIPLDDKNWELAETYHVHTKAIAFDIPKGTTTDLASVPRIFWNMIAPFGLHTAAAVAHDYLYRTAKMKVQREQADNVFLELMLRAGVSPFKAHLMYKGVRLFGSGSFKERQ
ncbi:DUF1353 domain-containing protein [Aeromonas veronii]|uniref:DUF1353 domain-containing protein n=1 Tax=Aeromonas veronii TaxID=654 RepID=UPI00366F8E05